MEERGGFEPPRRSHACWFSRPVLSTTQPPLRLRGFKRLEAGSQEVFYS